MATRGTFTRWMLAVALVAGTSLRPVAAEPASVVRVESVTSTLLAQPLSYTVLLPPGYDADAPTGYPVVYLLHGRGDDMQAWLGALERVALAMAARELPPMILVAPDAPWSRRAGYYIDSEFAGDGSLPRGEKVESALAGELVAHIDATYRTQADRAGRIVAGYSMGGYGALRYALAQPEKFGAAIVLSPAVYVPAPPSDSSTREFGAFGRGAERFDAALYAAKNYPALLAARTAQTPPLALFIAVGDDEHANADPQDATHDLDYEAHTFYNHARRAPGVRAQLRVVDGGHNWKVWQPMLLEGLRWLRVDAATAAR